MRLRHSCGQFPTPEIGRQARLQQPHDNRSWTDAPEVSELPRTAANRNIMAAPMMNLIPVISVTASASMIDLLAIIVEAQQAVARTMARAGIVPVLRGWEAHIVRDIS